MNGSEIQTLRSLRQALSSHSWHVDDRMRDADVGHTLFHLVHRLPLETRYLELKRLALSFIGPGWAKEDRLNVLVDEVDNLLTYAMDRAQALSVGAR